MKLPFFSVILGGILAVSVVSAGCADDPPFEGVHLQTSGGGVERVIRVDARSGCALTTTVGEYSDFCDSAAAPTRTMQFCFGQSILDLPDNGHDFPDLAAELVDAGQISSVSEFLIDSDGGSFDPNLTMPADVLLVLTNDPAVQVNAGIGAGLDCFVADRIVVETGAPDGVCNFIPIPSPSGTCPSSP